MTQDAMTLRALRADDRAEWARLWTGYLAFYETELPGDIFDLTFSRLLSDAEGAPSGLVLSHPGDDAPALAGLVHHLPHAHCWRRAPIVYLQDLYVDPQYRGQGYGRVLIEGVYAAADAAGASGVYWMTQDFNHEARKLYDRIGVLTPFIKYQRP